MRQKKVFYGQTWRFNYQVTMFLLLVICIIWHNVNLPSRPVATGGHWVAMPPPIFLRPQIFLCPENFLLKHIIKTKILLP